MKSNQKLLKFRQAIEINIFANISYFLLGEMVFIFSSKIEENSSCLWSK
ncbi:MAG: hypothetical protein ACFBSE_23795 [Prochloraceae cyanobacterium]